MAKGLKPTLPRSLRHVQYKHQTLKPFLPKVSHPNPISIYSPEISLSIFPLGIACDFSILTHPLSLSRYRWWIRDHFISPGISHCRMIQCLAMHFTPNMTTIGWCFRSFISKRFFPDTDRSVLFLEFQAWYWLVLLREPETKPLADAPAA